MGVRIRSLSIPLDLKFSHSFQPDVDHSGPDANQLRTAFCPGNLGFIELHNSVKSAVYGDTVDLARIVRSKHPMAKVVARRKSWHGDPTLTTYGSSAFNGCNTHG